MCSLLGADLWFYLLFLPVSPLKMGSNALTLTFYRNTMAVPVLLVILLIRKIDLRITGRELLALIVISVLFSVTTTYILYDAYNYIGVGLSTTLHFLYPMFTVVFGFLLFKRKLGKEKIIALILATIGVAMATGNSDMFAAKGILLALLSAVTYGGLSAGHRADFYSENGFNEGDVLYVHYQRDNGVSCSISPAEMWSMDWSRR